MAKAKKTYNVMLRGSVDFIATVQADTLGEALVGVKDLLDNRDSLNDYNLQVYGVYQE